MFNNKNCAYFCKIFSTCLFVQFNLLKLLTDYSVAFTDIFDAHSNVLHAEVHLKLLQPQVTTALHREWLCPDEHLSFYTLCKH